MTQTAVVTPNSPVQLDRGFLSSFNVTVAPNNRLAYSITIILKDEEGHYNFVEIRVLENKQKTFDTVEMAGLTWMAFNATSSDPAQQVFPIDGLSVEEMYQKNWPQAIGNFFQYGRKKGYSLWTKNDPDGNADTPRNIPWTDLESMPLPPLSASRFLIADLDGNIIDHHYGRFENQFTKLTIDGLRQGSYQSVSFRMQRNVFLKSGGNRRFMARYRS